MWHPIFTAGNCLTNSDAVLSEIPRRLAISARVRKLYICFDLSFGLDWRLRVAAGDGNRIASFSLYCIHRASIAI
jgi:hypothetical protein